MKLDIVEYVKGCAECQRHKVNNRPTQAALHPIYPKPEAMPFETVAIDFITKLPISQGYNSILTVTNHDCTKAAIFIPCNEESTQKRWQRYTSDKWSPTLDYPARSVATETHDLRPNSHENSVG